LFIKTNLYQCSSDSDPYTAEIGCACGTSWEANHVGDGMSMVANHVGGGMSMVATENDSV
jgi:hypothetical protein